MFEIENRLGGHRHVRRTFVGFTRLLGVVAGATAVMLALALGTTAVDASPAQLPGLEPIPAPVTDLSADGTSATDGVRTLTVSQAYDLDPAGQTLVVSGSGYDDFKGIYVAFCVIPPTNERPSPCGGGAALEGSTGASQWVSSNPPAAGVGLAIPYGPGGSFEVVVDVGPTINGSIDCRRVSCAVVTRNDHTRGSDRGQDIFVPVTFASEAVAIDEPVGSPDPATPGIASPDTPVTDAAPPAEVTTTTVASTTTTVDPTFELESAAGDAGSGSGSALPWIIGGTAVGLAAVAAGTWFVVTRRRPDAGS